MTAAPIKDAVVKHMEFVRLHDRKVLCVFVDRSGVVSHRIIEVAEDYEPGDLERAGHYLVEEFGGLSLGEIRARVVGLMAQGKAAFDQLLKNAVNLGTRYLDAEQHERRLVLEGTTHIMKHRELSDGETMPRLLVTFAHKHRI